MNTETELKQIVKEKYGQIARQSSSSCGCSCSGVKSDESAIMSDEYKNLNGYVAEADLQLGCGVPTEFAGIKKGDVVVDLGSGAGNDVFVARAIAGNEGRVIGIDMTEEMIAKANRNKAKLGYDNVEFIFGEIENIPLPENSTDVVISNCVLNLVPNKRKAFAEINRILKPGAHFCVSDIVLKGELPEGMQKDAEMYAGCVSGAVQQNEYLKIIEETGFTDVQIKTTKTIQIPDDIMSKYFSAEELKSKKVPGIYSITVVAVKK